MELQSWKSVIAGSCWSGPCAWLLLVFSDLVGQTQQQPGGQCVLRHLAAALVGLPSGGNPLPIFWWRREHVEIRCGTCAMSKPIGSTEYTIDVRIFGTPLVLVQVLSCESNLPFLLLRYLSYFFWWKASFIGQKLNHFQFSCFTALQTRPIAGHARPLSRVSCRNARSCCKRSRFFWFSSCAMLPWPARPCMPPTLVDGWKRQQPAAVQPWCWMCVQYSVLPNNIVYIYKYNIDTDTDILYYNCII